MMPRFLTVYLSLLFAAFAFNADRKTSEQNALVESGSKQESFTGRLLPIIEDENRAILKDREIVISFFRDFPQERIDRRISNDRLDTLMAVARKYRICDMFDKREYLEKIDTVPVSLVLSQAALESGWGTSRFSRHANNLFGQKTFSKKARSIKSKSGDDRYSSFKTTNESIRSYMLNLNSHDAYREFRSARVAAHEKNRTFTGLKAARTLKNYSEIGHEYTKMVSEMIKTHFASFDGTKNILMARANLLFFTPTR